MLQIRLTFRKIYTKEELNAFHNTIVEQRKPRFSNDEKTILTTNKTSKYFLTELKAKNNELLWGQNDNENVVRTKKSVSTKLEIGRENHHTFSTNRHLPRFGHADIFSSF